MGEIILLEQERSTRAVPQPGNCVPVDRVKRVHLHFILLEYQVSTQEHVRGVERQQISVPLASAAKLEKLSDVLKFQHLHTFTHY